MAIQWLRRAGLAAACALLLASCGGGDIVSQFTPSRMVSFGDGFADVGQNGRVYSINNDGTVANWTTYLASAYGVALDRSSAGGLAYARGNARVAGKPDAAGNAATLTVTEQIDTFLAGGTPGPDDLVIINAGVADVVYQTKAVLDGTISADTALSEMTVAGEALGAQVRRLVSAGAQHVVVVGTYNVGRSAWAAETGQGGLMESLSSQFNQKMLVSIVDLGRSVLYVDAAYYLNLVVANPSNYNFTNTSDVVCTSVDPGPGIGTGPGRVNSNLCDVNTLLPGVDRTLYLWADRVYPTPHGHQQFGDFAYNKIRERW